MLSEHRLQNMSQEERLQALAEWLERGNSTLWASLSHDVYDVLAEIKRLNWAKQIEEIRQLLTEMYDHAIAHGLDHWKSSEAAIMVHWPDYFNEKYNRSEPISIDIYSYVFFVEGRLLSFLSLEGALKFIRGKHSEVMEITSWGSE